MKRGDIVLVSLPGDFGKPRPALVVQTDLVPATYRTVTLLPITSDIQPAPDFRITLEPSARNGLRKVSQVMVDKTMTHLRSKLRDVIGTLDDDTLTRINRALALWLGLAG
ncbi:MAG TPA: type II toxin-antitoxin system PemK/MazF family toxin [Vicinamibacteria bacterium]|nr:type II toxin-antitoxin system PemK/MazF family toxin [Vicinamibacteria bacterium]